MAISYVGESTFVAGTAITITQSVSVDSPSTVEIDDVYVATLITKTVGATANPTSVGSAPTTGDVKVYENVNDCTSAADDHQPTVWVGVVTTGGVQTYTFTKQDSDGLVFALKIVWYRGVDTADPVDATAAGATETVGATDDVSFPAYDPTSTDNETCYIAYYSDDQTAYSAAMSDDTNPDCTIRFDVETNTGSDGSMALTSGPNNGSSIAARTWASNATNDSGNTGVVFALRAAGGAAASTLLLVAKDMKGCVDMHDMRG